MGDYELKPNEEWVLGILDRHCATAGRGSQIQFRPSHWRGCTGGKAHQEVTPKMSKDELFRHVANLEGLGLAGYQSTSEGFYVWITPAGRQHARCLESPDWVDKATRWARRNPLMAGFLIAYSTIGSAGGWLVIILEILSLLGLIGGGQSSVR